SNVRIQLEKTTDQVAIGYKILKMQMGLNINDSVVLSDDLNILYTSSNVASLLDAKPTYSSRIEYQMVEQQERLNEFDRRRYEMGYIPTLGFFATLQRNNYGKTFSDAVTLPFLPGSGFGLQLNVPIFDGLRKSAQIQQSRLT